MNIAENRDFKKYYGISNSENYFAKHSADDCASSVVFESILPQNILKPDHSANSFMILSSFGTGKTLLRCEYYHSLESEKYFKVLILNKQINEYLERFVSSSSNGMNCKGDDCLMGWSEKEFAQMILSLLVTKLVDDFYKKQFLLPAMSLDEKMELITIICFYYNHLGTEKLEAFINSFLKKSDEKQYSVNKDYVGTNKKNENEDKIVFKIFLNDLKKSTTLRYDDKRMELLSLIIKGEDFHSKSTEKLMYDNTINDLTLFTIFMKNHIKTVVFIIDGIDENRYFFSKGKINKKSLEIFYRSTVSQEIVAVVMAQNFYLSLFYPTIDDVHIRDAIIRNDKFPVYDIKWERSSLINYADYLLEKMSANASITRCKPFINFKKLLNYDHPMIAESLDEIKTPRELNYFINELIVEMNNCANTVRVPFIATYENVRAALKKSNKYNNKYNNGP